MPQGKKGKGRFTKKKIVGKTRQQQWADSKEQLYAVTIDKPYGKSVNVLCDDMRERAAYIRAAFRGIRIKKGDVLLISLRTDLTSDKRVDIIEKYNDNNVRVLRVRGEIDFATELLGSLSESGSDPKEKSGRSLPEQWIPKPISDESSDEISSDKENEPSLDNNLAMQIAVR